MPYLYHFNAFFEYELSTYPNLYNPPQKLQQYAQALNYFFLLLADRDDLVWMQGAEPEVLAVWQQWDTANGKTKTQIQQVKQGYELIQWGRTSHWQDKEIVQDESLVKNARRLNSKFEQALWKIRYAINAYTPVFSNEMPTEEMTYPLLVRNKAFAFSGRDSYVVQDRKHLQMLLGKEQKLVLEPYLAAQKKQDFSEIVELRQGSMQHLAYTEMYVNSKNHFEGCVLCDDLSENTGRSFPERSLCRAMSKCRTGIEKHLQSPFADKLTTILQQEQLEYEGPLSIDFFSYQEEDGKSHWHFCEANFRFTMGRMLYEIHRKLALVGKYSGLFLLSCHKSVALTYFSQQQFLAVTPFWQQGKRFSIWLYGNDSKKEALNERFQELQKSFIGENEE
ncbi:MAG: hypothetical protein AAF518_16180 [Spirochaetota bacterium]